jgi:hypothetical protein
MSHPITPLEHAALFAHAKERAQQLRREAMDQAWSSLWRAAVHAASGIGALWRPRLPTPEL